MNVKETERKKAEDLFRNGLKPKEISGILGVHISTIYSWKKEFDQSHTSFIPKEKDKKEKIESISVLEKKMQIFVKKIKC